MKLFSVPHSDTAMDIVGMDHGYSKPWSAHPDASHARPVKLMYMQRVPRNQTAENSKYVKLESPIFVKSLIYKARIFLL